MSCLPSARYKCPSTFLLRYCFGTLLEQYREGNRFPHNIYRQGTGIHLYVLKAQDKEEVMSDKNSTPEERFLRWFYRRLRFLAAREVRAGLDVPFRANFRPKESTALIEEDETEVFYGVFYPESMTLQITTPRGCLSKRAVSRASKAAPALRKSIERAWRASGKPNLLKEQSPWHTDSVSAGEYWIGAGVVN